MTAKSTYYFLINSLEGGGAERVVINLTTSLMKQGKKVYIITLKSTIFYDLPLGAKHISLSNIKNNILMFILIPWYVQKFKKIIKIYGLSEGISLLEIANFVHILAKKNATISFRTHINVFIGVFGFLHTIIIKALYPKASKIIVNSLENKFDIAHYLDIPEDKIEVLYNQLDLQDIVSKSKEPVDKNIVNKIKGRKVFITIGRLITSKHHNKIIQVFARIGIQKDWIYLIVGDGPQRRYLEKLTQKYGLEKNILFLGVQKNVFKYLHLADYFLYASEVEGFPNVLAEARAMHIPIITTDFKSGAREIITGGYIKEQIPYPYHGAHGIIIDPSNIVTQLQNLLINFLQKP